MENFEREAIELKAKVHEKLANHIVGDGIYKTMKNIIMTHGLLSGSAISSIYHDEKVNDFDIYFQNQSMVDSVQRIVKSDESWLQEVEDWNGYKDNQDILTVHGKLITDRAITFKNKVQFIIMAPLEKCRPTFDFIHCMPYYDLGYNKLYISQRQLYSIKNKTLIFNPSRECHPSLARIEKFQKRGWKLDIRKSVIPTTDLTKTPELV